MSYARRSSRRFALFTQRINVQAKRGAGRGVEYSKYNELAAKSCKLPLSLSLFLPFSLWHLLHARLANNLNKFTQNKKCWHFARVDTEWVIDNPAQPL